MIRKLILGAVAAVAIGVGASEASAAPPIVVQPGTGGFYPPSYPPSYPQYPQRRDHDYAVYVQHRGHWDFYGRYETRWQAERAERYLEYQGRRARIEVIHDHR